MDPPTIVDSLLPTAAPAGEEDGQESTSAEDAEAAQAAAAGDDEQPFPADVDVDDLEEDEERITREAEEEERLLTAQSELLRQAKFALLALSVFFSSVGLLGGWEESWNGMLLHTKDLSKALLAVFSCLVSVLYILWLGRAANDVYRSFITSYYLILHCHCLVKAKLFRLSLGPPQ